MTTRVYLNLSSRAALGQITPQAAVGPWATWEATRDEIYITSHDCAIFKP